MRFGRLNKGNKALFSVLFRLLDLLDLDKRVAKSIGVSYAISLELSFIFNIKKSLSRR